MKEIYLLRHGEKDAGGKLTENGKRTAKAARSTLPRFARIVSSDVERAVLTAKLIAGKGPTIDRRAAYASAPPEISLAINTLAKKHGISFLDAARTHNDPEVLRGIDELLEELAENEKALVVSHDLTIMPAMEFRGMPFESIEPLCGYVIRMSDGAVSVRRYSMRVQK